MVPLISMFTVGLASVGTAVLAFNQALRSLQTVALTENASSQLFTNVPTSPAVQATQVSAGKSEVILCHAR